VQPLGGAAEALFGRNRHKIPKVAQLHGESFYFSVSIILINILAIMQLWR
jgi:hypothetical protein